MRTWLKKLRENAGFTHEQVADGAKLSRSYYTNIENGLKTPSVKAAKSIARVLNFQWELFFNEKCSFKEQNIELEQKEVV
ncbi:helix-turn-helix transcriptional regulator [Paenibacillus sp. 3LSP]|jgi:transcriptional regulator with XRE-family HTH domain|uniref:helix-turn-helix transcriptional regulator n=1 Tax=Paenibacillus sp. 3LSP TaxID=2800795 RepID=UPI0028FD6DE0|nr:helix-turn-helix transcriptional regulator [Paenibacillus sp. 3LSP]MDU0329265.1 helix-turn-helix transcriptional regulator [Paenibacillus sp. 3LSP]